jgi:hypothetical protein
MAKITWSSISSGFKNLFTAQNGLFVATGVFILGILVMCICSSIFGLQIADDLCAVEDKSPSGTDDANDDPNYVWKAFFWVTSGIGWSPILLLIVYLFLKYGCNSNKMVFAGILSVVFGGTALALTSIKSDLSNMRELVGGAMGGLVTLFLTLGISQPSSPLQWMTRMSIIGFIFFGWMITIDSFALIKYDDCQKERGCDGSAVCDNTCSSPPTKLPCGDCKECDEHKGVKDQMWAVNGTAIGGFVLSVAGIIASFFVG